MFTFLEIDDDCVDAGGISSWCFENENAVVVC